MAELKLFGYIKLISFTFNIDDIDQD